LNYEFTQNNNNHQNNNENNNSNNIGNTMRTILARIVEKPDHTIELDG
jgi:hypothetical protein